MSNIRMKKPTMEELDKQESLTPERLKSLTSTAVVAVRVAGPFSAEVTPQPKSGIAALVNWTHDNFAYTYLQHVDKNIKLINNRIVIDGQFMHFCDIKKLKVECIHTDALISWRSETGVEKFLAQGVFKISAKGFSFLHGALFNNGVQTEEEEVFHFVIVNERDMYKYLKLRNDFDSWIKEREGLQEKSANGSMRKIAGLDRYAAKIKK